MPGSPGSSCSLLHPKNRWGASACPQVGHPQVKVSHAPPFSAIYRIWAKSLRSVMTLDVRSASVLLECARHGSLGRAAIALNMTQPALTRTLKLVEASYGVQLFERTTRGVVPTVYGEALLPYARLVVSEVANAEDLIRQMRGASRGVVRIGGVASVVPSFIVTAIARMREKHPDLRFQIVEEMEDLLLEGLKSGDIDIAISPEPYADDEI